LFDMSGKILATYQPSGKKVAIETAHLPAGIYMLQLGNGQQKQSVRFVKK